MLSRFIRIKKLLKVDTRIQLGLAIIIIVLAVPVRRWRPVMRRPVMPTDIIASQET